MTRVAVLGQVRIFRVLVARVLAHRTDLTVLGEAGPDPAGLSRIRRLRPDVLLVDVTPPGAVGGLRDLTAGLPGVRTVAIGALSSDDAVVACLEAGAAACVDVDGDLGRLVDAVRQAVGGAVVCSPAITGGLFRRLAALAAEQRGAPAAEPLTQREHEIAGLLAAGLSNREIGRRLFIEVSTVKNHVHNILDKLRLPGRCDVASWYTRNHCRPPGD